MRNIYFATILLVGSACGDSDDGDSTASGSASEESSISAPATMTSMTGTSMTGTSMSGTSMTGTTMTTTGSGSGTASDSGSDTNAETGACTPEGGSCLEQACCGRLMCCSGIPIPEGEATCFMDCPDSDQNLKENFVEVDTAKVLGAVASMPISTWEYRNDESDARHLGPMAQDFKAAFGLGATDRAIHKIDGDGVALAAIQELNRRLEAAESENAELRAAVRKLERRLQAVERD